MTVFSAIHYYNDYFFLILQIFHIPIFGKFNKVCFLFCILSHADLHRTFSFTPSIYCFLTLALYYFVQLMSMQKEMQKQMSMVVAVPLTKEGKRLEAALGRSMEKAVKANNDALWARFQEENAKNEKLFRDRTQQITTLINNVMTKDLPTILEKTLKKELAAVGPALVRTITPVIEKTISSVIADSFQVRIMKILIFYKKVIYTRF